MKRKTRDPLPVRGDELHAKDMYVEGCHCERCMSDAERRIRVAQFGADKRSDQMFVLAEDK